MKKLYFLLSVLIFSLGITRAQTFKNPLLPSGADPYSYYKDGFYYYTNSAGNRVELWKSKTLEGLKDAPHKTIWKAPSSGPYSRNIWAPEVMFLRGKWYAYFAADNGKNENHRMYVLENSSKDPMEGEWVFKGQINDSTNKWAIDGDVAEINGKLYMIWSGWEGDVNGKQEIFMAKLKNPWTVEGERYKISSPKFEWEKIGDLGNSEHVDVNEGPQFLVHNNKVFIIYSASGCWTDFYALGMLFADLKSNLLDPKSWSKFDKPVFQRSVENGVYAPGHNSFFKSPDGKEDWILYHANDKPGQGCGGFRSPRAQKFTWNVDGTPNFGIPVKTSLELDVPSEKNKLK
ncbi:family 43 glycosylhydrolase [Pedobacter fastidiosus]|uniref:Glycoside hydrolase family 43 protein n=1 Tax=Pedobacter fastidiosus TaxID=2765361 RepID=A0ABR7KTL5_9SPHI|nr:glycoside hydrolase family 43 protein [Pedobacter fastidiosus]MBC6111446.1 glycoside hydrolase family 43 protein [Pedobacter fastidiosus]